MDYYTLEWKKYIYDNYYHNICDENYKINQKYLVFKSDLRNSIPDYMNDQTKWLVMEDRDAYKKYIKNIIEEENKLTFSDELLKQEFSIYYNNKKEYINNESFLEKKFKKYQIVKLLSYNEELIQFKNRIEICAL